MSHQGHANSRVQFMNCLNVLACFAVICLHCSQVVFRPSASITWYYSVVMQSVFIFAVPIFFMLSGANLLGYRKRYSTKTFFKKRLKKTLVALIVGSALVYCITCFCPELFCRVPRRFSLLDFVSLFLNNEIEPIYWFFYVILVVYLMTPLLSLLADSKKVLLYAILLLGFASSVLPFLSRYVPAFLFLQSLFGAQALTGGITFFLLGYYLQNYAPRQRPAPCVLAFALFTALMIAATIAINLDAVQQPDISYEGFFSNAFSFFSIGASSALFLLFKSAEPRFQQLSSAHKSVLQRLSSASLGVYVIHLLVMDYIAFVLPHPWSISMTIEPPVVYLITVVIVMIAQSAWTAGKKGLARGKASLSRS